MAGARAFTTSRRAWRSGLAIIGVVAAFGVAELVQSSRLLYEGLRWAGVAFLLYLAWEGWTGGTDVVASDSRSRGR